ncbi:putative enzyme related to lactoylglutathione lyase [Kribbella amoyensis]|uniref:Putative enzyme related to lactoylglutathione lyase n=1 Tax=Kribbella amoyensis TaxID=996641 RepID=A0A561BR39_9ACTN|nr:VOC family protein [Kribbella amoyensis]TWD81339.1 putative enzyme related to lactoylglutathione lyase [Kribbella amoyensis]
MDVLSPRLLVRDFGTAVEFYRGVLAELFGVQPVKVVPEASYANWDLDGQAGLAVFSRAAIASAVGTESRPTTAAPSQDTTMLVFKVDDVDAATKILTRYGATVVAPPQDRPQWGPGLRTAHLRDPEGTLLELQTY